MIIINKEKKASEERFDVNSTLPKGYCRCDTGILSSIKYLKCRIEDLNIRARELDRCEYGPLFHDYYDVGYSKEELGYITPEYFMKITDVEEALNIAMNELEAIILTKQGIDNCQINSDVICSYKTQVSDFFIAECAA